MPMQVRWTSQFWNTTDEVGGISDGHKLPVAHKLTVCDFLLRLQVVT
jgi:hypothetical protein